MVVFNQLKKFFVGLYVVVVVFLLGIPYGSAPAYVEVRSTTFDNGPVVCTMTEEGAEANIQIKCHNKGRPFETNLPAVVMVRTYKMLDDNGTRVPSQDLPVCDEYTFEGNPLYIKNGQDFTLNVCLTFGDYSAPGTYSVEIRVLSAPALVYEDVLIVPEA